MLVPSVFFSQAAPLIAALNSLAVKHSLTTIAQADHIGFKCGSRAEFEAIRTMLERESVFIYQSIISNRPIAIIKLNQPLTTDLGSLNYLELSDQKPDNSQTTGFDHVEITPKHISYQELVARLQQAGEPFIEKARPHHTTFDLKLGAGTIRLEPEPLMEKIKKQEIA
jgi:predicted metalloenzyme YecM